MGPNGLVYADIQSFSRGNATLYDTHIPQDVWCVSTAVTTSRVLAIVSVLRAMSLFEGKS